MGGGRGSGIISQHHRMDTEAHLQKSDTAIETLYQRNKQKSDLNVLLALQVLLFWTYKTRQPFAFSWNIFQNMCHVSLSKALEIF